MSTVLAPLLTLLLVLTAAGVCGWAVRRAESAQLRMARIDTATVERARRQLQDATDGVRDAVQARPRR